MYSVVSPPSTTAYRLTNSSETGRMIQAAIAFYSVIPLHTIDQCRPYYPSQHCHYAMHIIRSSLELRHTEVLPPVSYPIPNVQFSSHTNIKS